MNGYYEIDEEIGGSQASDYEEYCLLECSAVSTDIYEGFGEICYFIFRLEEAAGSSNKINHIPEDTNHHRYPRENPSSHQVNMDDLHLIK
jgi:hypothetical protein